MTSNTSAIASDASARRLRLELEALGNAAYRRHLAEGRTPALSEVHREAVVGLLGQRLGPLYERVLEYRPTLDPADSERPYQLQRGGRRKAQGSYFTPPAVVDFLVRRTLNPLTDRPAEEILRLRVLDPAVGAGCFLVAAAEFLARALAEARQLEGSESHLARCRSEVIGRCLFGADIDPIAVELTRLRLAEEAGEPDWATGLLARHVRCGDSLGESQPAVEWGRGFDAVLGNPPWGRCRPTPGLLRRFPTFQPRHANLSGPFTELGLSLSEQGRLGFVLPAAWLEIESARLLRRRLCSTRRIEMLVQAHQLFSGAGGPAVDCVLLVVGPSGPSLTLPLFRLNDRDSVPGRLEQLRREAWSDARTIPLTTAHLDGAALPLRRPEFAVTTAALQGEAGSVGQVRIGTQEYALGGGSPAQTAEMIAARAYHAERRLGPDYVRSVPGSAVQRFRLAWAGGYVRWGANLHCPRDRTIFTREHLLLGRVFDARRRLFRCCHVPAREDGFWCNNTDSFNVWLADDAPCSLFALLGVLGSRLLGRLAFEKFVSLQRQVFPKLSVRMVRSLPLPHRDRLIQKRELVRDLDALMQRVVAEGLTPEREQRLEDLVGGLYGSPADAADEEREHESP